MEFGAEYCDRCKHMPDDTLADNRGYCETLVNGMLYEIGEPDFPKEWVRGETGFLHCTKFELKISE